MAACLLMPEKSFRNQYNALKDSRTHEELVKELGEIFCTPQESVIRRIDERRDAAGALYIYNIGRREAAPVIPIYI